MKKSTKKSGKPVGSNEKPFVLFVEPNMDRRLKLKDSLNGSVTLSCLPTTEGIDDVLGRRNAPKPDVIVLGSCHHEGKFDLSLIDDIRRSYRGTLIASVRQESELELLSDYGVDVIHHADLFATLPKVLGLSAHV